MAQHASLMVPSIYSPTYFRSNVNHESASIDVIDVDFLRGPAESRSGFVQTRVSYFEPSFERSWSNSIGNLSTLNASELDSSLNSSVTFLERVPPNLRTSLPNGTTNPVRISSNRHQRVIMDQPRPLTQAGRNVQSTAIRFNTRRSRWTSPEHNTRNRSLRVQTGRCLREFVALFTVAYVYEIRSKEKDECPLCLSEIEYQDPVRRLPCMHLFHTECVDPWLTAEGVPTIPHCPMCRTELDRDLKEYTQPSLELIF